MVEHRYCIHPGLQAATNPERRSLDAPRRLRRSHATWLAVYNSESMPGEATYQSEGLAAGHSLIRVSPQSRFHHEVDQTPWNDNLFDYRFAIDQGLDPVVRQCRLAERCLAGIG